MAGTPGEQRLRDLALLRRVKDRIDREYAQPLDVEALARGVHMSAGHLSRAFKPAYGEPPYSYLMTRRIERAMALLRRGDLSVTEVCFTVGCSSLGTFSTRFTELVGVSPSAYRQATAAAAAGIPSCVAKQVTRPIRNREATGPEADANVSAMDITINATMLPATRDPEASLAFYRDVLGFEVRIDVGRGTCAGSPSALSASPSTAIVLTRPPSTPGSPRRSAARSPR